MTDTNVGRASMSPGEPSRSRYTAVASQGDGQVQFVSRTVLAEPGGDPWRVALGYRRFREFDRGNYAGQDWCALGVDRGRCVGVVADGVSQSFMGDIAAQRAGAALWQHLMGLQQPFTADDVREWFDGFSRTIHREVEEYQLTPNLPEMLKTSLEGKRHQHGSQTVMAAFTLDLAARRGQVLLIGDVHVVVHHGDGRREVIVADARARWSSLKGLRGEPRIVPVEDVAGILLFSDGLDASFGDDVERAFDRPGFLVTAEASAERDDVSVVAVTRRASTAGFADADGTLHDPPPDPASDSADLTTKMTALTPVMPILEQTPRLQGSTATPATVVAPTPQPIHVDPTSAARAPSYRPPPSQGALAQATRPSTLPGLPPTPSREPNAGRAAPGRRRWGAPVLVPTVVILAAVVVAVALLVNHEQTVDSPAPGDAGSGRPSVVPLPPQPAPGPVQPRRLPVSPTLPRGQGDGLPPGGVPSVQIFVGKQDPPPLPRARTRPGRGNGGRSNDSDSTQPSSRPAVANTPSAQTPAQLPSAAAPSSQRDTEAVQPAPGPSLPAQPAPHRSTDLSPGQPANPPPQQAPTPSTAPPPVRPAPVAPAGGAAPVDAPPGPDAGTRG